LLQSAKIIDSFWGKDIAKARFPLQDKLNLAKKVIIRVFTDSMLFKSNLADADSHTPYDFYEAIQLLKKSFGVQLDTKILDHSIDYSSAGFSLTLSMRSAENSYYSSLMYQA
jgi:hypothetical protein